MGILKDIAKGLINWHNHRAMALSQGEIIFLKDELLTLGHSPRDEARRLYINERIETLESQNLDASDNIR